MENQIKNNQSDQNWYYIIAQNPGTSEEELLGFTDEKNKEKFIPAFKTKKHAKKCFAKMPKDAFNEEYDTQAVIEEDLFTIAKTNGHKIYLLDENGSILKHLN